MHHYTETELERYRDGHMNFVLRLLCKIHLWNCIACRERLEKINEDDLLLRDLKDVLKTDDVPENDHTYRKLCVHFHGEKGSSI